MHPTKSQTFVSLITLAFVLLSGCWWPEKIDAKLEIKADSTYRFQYEGVLAFAPAIAELVQSGRLDSNTERELGELEKEMARDPDVKSCKYQGKGRFRVVMEKSGSLPALRDIPRPIELFGESLPLLKITPLLNGGLEIRGISLNENDRQQAKSLGLGYSGTIEVDSKLEVLEHNGKSSRPGKYTWKVSLNDESAPRLVVGAFEMQDSPLLSDLNPIWLIAALVGVIACGGVVQVLRKRKIRKAPDLENL